MKKRMTVMIIALAIVFGGIIGFNLLKAFMIKRFFASYKPPAVTVSSVIAKSVNWQPRIDAVGNFVAINGVEVNSEISGKVVELHFDSGQYIEKDQPLIVIDDTVQQAMLKFNQAELILKQLSYKRQTDLFKRGATPSSSVDEAKAELDKAQANVEKIQAEINQKHIQSPFTGRLGIRQVNLGQYISPGQTSIVSLQSMDPLYLEFYLPEQLYKKLHINQSITFSLDEFPNAEFMGKITAINSKVDPNTHNILVQATLPNCPADAIKNPKQSNLIKLSPTAGGKKMLVTCNSELNSKAHVHQFTFIPGMFAAIEVEQPALPDTVVLPSTAISYSLYGNSVFIVQRGKDADGEEELTVKREFITIGERRGNFTVIKKGVKAGQEVVNSGELKLQNGTRININNDVKLDESIDLNDLGE